ERCRNDTLEWCGFRRILTILRDFLGSAMGLCFRLQKPEAPILHSLFGGLVMHRPDRIGVLVLAFFVFSLYVCLANILTSSALVSLPLGTIGSVRAETTAILTFPLF